VSGRTLSYQKNIIMKRRILLFTILAAICLLQSCISSLRPLYTEKDLIFDPRLLGEWKQDDGNTVLIREYTNKDLTLNHKGYLLICNDKGGGDVRFVGNLVALGGNVFLDLYPIAPDDDSKKGDDRIGHLLENYIPTHSYYKVKVADKQIQLFSFASQKLYDMLGENRIRLKHEDLENYKVITASTQEIQQFVKKYADRDDLFDKAGMLKK
jgi:hypothetical protein